MEKNDKKRVRGAQKTQIGKIIFRSKLEAKVYTILKGLKFNPSYETETFTIIDKFEWQGKKYRPTTYTPDIIVNRDGIKYIIECKGFITDTFPLKKKLFVNYLRINNLKDYHYYVIKTSKDLTNLIDIIHKNNVKKNTLRRRLLPTKQPSK